MKNLKTMFIIMLILLTITGCGKEKKSNVTGVTKNPVTQNPVTPVLPPIVGIPGADAMTTLRQWLSSAENSSMNLGLYSKQITSIGGFQFNFQGTICWNNCQASLFPKCILKNPTGGYDLGDTQTTSCGNLIPYQKSANLELSKAINGEPDLELIDAIPVPNQPSVFRISYKLKTSLSTTPKVVHYVRTDFPSALNPVQTDDYRIGKRTTITLGLIR